MESIENEIIINSVEMIIVDSLASIVRREFAGNDSSILHARAIFLANTSNRLKAISQFLDLSVNKSHI